MGGRGSTSGLSGGGGISVTHNGETTDYYFTSSGGQNYYQRGIDGMPEPTPQNMSAREFQKRVSSNDAQVNVISAAERKKQEKERKEERAKTNKYLDEQWYKAAPRPRKGWKGH